MLVVVTYDVNTADAAGAKRLRKVARLCERYGMRVQNSVFEVLLDAAHMTTLKHELAKAIDPGADSVRFYRIGNAYQSKIETIGRSSPVQAGEPLLL